MQTKNQAKQTNKKTLKRQKKQTNKEAALKQSPQHKVLNAPLNSEYLPGLFFNGEMVKWRNSSCRPKGDTTEEAFWRQQTRSHQAVWDPHPRWATAFPTFAALTGPRPEYPS